MYILPNYGEVHFGPILKSSKSNPLKMKGKKMAKCLEKLMKYHILVKMHAFRVSQMLSKHEKRKCSNLKKKLGIKKKNKRN